MMWTILLQQLVSAGWHSSASYWKEGSLPDISKCHFSFIEKSGLIVRPHKKNDLTQIKDQSGSYL